MSNTVWVEALGRAPLSERGAMLEALVVAEFRAWLLMSDADALPLDESYFALGLTSLGAVEIQERLESILGRRIDSASLFNNPTIENLLLHVRSQVLSEFFPSPPPGRHGPASTSETAEADTLARLHTQKQLLTSVLDELYEV
jgi:aryl carrier-like protein